MIYIMKINVEMVSIIHAMNIYAINIYSKPILEN